MYSSVHEKASSSEYLKVRLVRGNREWEMESHYFRQHSYIWISFTRIRKESKIDSSGNKLLLLMPRWYFDSLF